MKASQILRRSLVLLFTMALLGGVVSEANAQYFSFGKNRVQYDSFNWRFIQSEHFDIYYYKSKNYDLANFAAYSLEASLKQIQNDFDHQIADRIQVILYDSHNDFAQTNTVALPLEQLQAIGGVTDPYKNRITMPFNGNYAEFRSTLQHELEHAVINDMFYGGNVQSRLSGNALQIPDWFNEGMAEYVSKGWDTETDMFIRDAVINNYLPPISRLGGYFAYRGGESIWNFIAEQYGRQKITEIMQGLYTRRSIPAAFKRALGVDMEEFSERWHDYYRKRYLPEVANREDISDYAELLTDEFKEGAYNTSPALSPQGDKIALITNDRGYFDVVVISAITGKKIKTLIKGEDNINFEQLTILKPNLTWSPDGEKIALSAKSKGDDHLAIVDYETGKTRMIKFPKLDAIGSVSWAPDGKKIAFDGNRGPYQDIYIYNLETQEFTNLTNDVISDYEPVWGPESDKIYFTSHRGDEVQLGQVKNTSRLLIDDDMYSSDIYVAKVGASKAQRLTKTPKWNEYQPVASRDGKLFYISDENGIPNIFLMDLKDRTSAPLTDLQTGVMQMSVSADASRMAVNSLNKGRPDIFLVRSPLSRKKTKPLEPNEWAQRRSREAEKERVPATGYVRQMLTNNPLGQTSLTQAVAAQVNPTPKQAVVVDTASTAPQDTAETVAEEQNSDNIDFRNYVFESSVESDSAFQKKYMDESKFDIKDNETEDGRFIPKDYRLKFTTDLVYAGGNFSTTYGSYGVTQVQISDLLGNHQIAFGSNLNLDLRNSTYFLQYSYLKNRTDWIFSFFHNSNSYQDFVGRLYRFRSYGGAVNMQYPIDKFRRIDAGLSVIGLAQDFSIAYADTSANNTSTFAYPQVIYTSDKTMPGYITPVSGSRYSVSLSGSPGIGALQFASILGDYRHYFNLGSGYTFAVRGSGAASFGHDSQTFFMGGMLGWINYKYNNTNTIPISDLGNRFITQPALPLRGHPYYASYGDRFGLVNAEFRFPLFAAILPGPIPVLPLYNLTGVAFMDAGMAWGQDITLDFPNNQFPPVTLNSSDLDFRVSKQDDIYINRSNGQSTSQKPADYQSNPNKYFRTQVNRGDILMGAGFGLRTIVFGLPLRYDVGWPLYRDGFGGKPIHYITIGIDF